MTKVTGLLGSMLIRNRMISYSYYDYSPMNTIMNALGEGVSDVPSESEDKKAAI